VSTHKHDEEDSQPDEDAQQGEPCVPREDIALASGVGLSGLLLLLHRELGSDLHSVRSGQTRSNGASSDVGRLKQ
jgi:hypothetical protein